MTAILIALNVAAGLFLIGVVLLQSGKGADMGAAFGGASSAVFGPSGAGNVLTKVTAATAAVFMGTSLALAVISAAASVPAVPAEEQAAVPLEQPAAGEGTPAARATDPLADTVKKAAQEAVDRAAGGTDATGAAAAESAGDAAKTAAERSAGEAAKAATGAPSSAPAPGGAPVDPVPSRP